MDVCRSLSQVSTGASGRTKGLSVCLSCPVSWWLGSLQARLAEAPFFPGQTAMGMLSKSNVSWSRVSRGTGLCEIVRGQQVRKDRWDPGQSLLERSLETPCPGDKVTCTLRSGGSEHLRGEGDFEPRGSRSSNSPQGCSWSSCRKGRSPGG